MSPAVALVESLRARGVELAVAGGRLRYSPADALAPDERDALRRHKAEVLALLAPTPAFRLDPATVREALGARPDPHAVACIRFDVLAIVHELRAAIAAGTLPPRCLVWGRPLADWLSLDDAARLLQRRGAGGVESGEVTR